MRDTNLVNALREHAEWARGNEWETPITLGDDLVEAADRIANQSTHIAELQQEIEKLRGQNRQLREAAALVAKESAELLERRWIPVTERLAAYEDTGLEPEEVLPKDKADEIALKLMRLADLESICSYTRLRELVEADRAGRLVVLPFTSGRTLLCEENIDSLRLMKDVELAIRYCSSCGIVFHMGYNVFCDLVKHGRITAVSEETEKALEAIKDE